MQLLEGKVAIVTGASRGIGRNIVMELAKEGADIVIAARTEETKERLPGTIYSVAEQVQALGRRALPVKCDVTSDEDIEAMVQRALAEFGHIDVLVNNAGIMSPGPVLDLPVKRWDIVMKVNVRGLFVCTKAVLPTMVEQKSGSIINISSIAALDATSGNVYGVSKAAVNRFSVGLAAEMKPHNIAVNSLSPRGLVPTEGWYYFNPTAAPPPNEEKPEVMGRAAVYLATQDANGVTGRVLFSQDFLKEVNLS